MFSQKKVKNKNLFSFFEVENHVNKLLSDPRTYSLLSKTFQPAINRLLTRYPNKKVPLSPTSSQSPESSSPLSPLCKLLLLHKLSPPSSFSNNPPTKNKPFSFLLAEQAEEAGHRIGVWVSGRIVFGGIWNNDRFQQKFMFNATVAELETGEEYQCGVVFKYVPTKQEINNTVHISNFSNESNQTDSVIALNSTQN